MKIKRRKTREIKIGKVKIGGNNPIAVQSMCDTKTTDTKKTIEQIHELEDAGCEIIRVAVPDMEAAKALKEIKENISIPLVADIHFDYRLALESAKNVDKIRINPGNIGDMKKVEVVVEECKNRGLPIRIGVNSGSVELPLIDKYGGPTPEAMVESALNHVKILEDLDFYDTAISVKASNVINTIDAYSLLSEKVDYPLHLGVTEAGTEFKGSIKSALGIGYLLAKGIGDTIRVSLTGNVIKEVEAGYEILKNLGLRTRGVNITSCPTCGRTEIDLVGLTKKVEELTKNIKEPLNIAVMGCIVNGVGEGKEADIGIAGGKGMGIIFKEGKIIKQCKEEELLEEFMKELNKMLKERKAM